MEQINLKIRVREIKLNILKGKIVSPYIYLLLESLLEKLKAKLNLDTNYPKNDIQ